MVVGLLGWWSSERLVWVLAAVLWWVLAMGCAVVFFFFFLWLGVEVVVGGGSCGCDCDCDCD